MDDYRKKGREMTDKLLDATLYDEEITQHSVDYSLPDYHPDKYPLIDPSTGERITDPYKWHVFNTILTMQPRIAAEMLLAMREKKTIIVMYTHHLEREEPGYCRAVVMARIAKRGYPLPRGGE